MIGGVVLLLVNGVVLAAGAVAARRVLGIAGRVPVFLAAAVLAWWWATVGVEALGSFGLLRTGPLAGWAAAGLGLALTASAARRRAAEPWPERDATLWDAPAILSLGLAIWVVLWFAVPSLVQPVKVVSDGPIYHLYLAARWWKAGRVFPVATPFGEVGATYFWANGEAWFAWLMTLEGGDRLARVGQVPFLAVGAVAAWALARRVGAGASASVIAACWFATVSPLVLFGCEPNVDAQFVAGYLLAAVFFLRFATGDRTDAELALGALAAGLTWGTKPTGIVFIPVLLALAGVGVLLAPDPPSVRARRILILILVPALGMGFWPARNLLLTGNPLYPLHLRIGGVTLLRGWFGPEVMERSHYYLPRGDWRAAFDLIVGVLDARLAPVWLAAVLGAWAVGRPREEGKAILGRWAAGLAGLAVVVVVSFWVVIPYRTQQRFMLPACGLAAAPLALLFDRGRFARWLGAGLLAVHALTAQTWPIGDGSRPVFWDLSPLVPSNLPGLIHAPAGAGPAAWGVGSIAVAWAWSRVAARPGRGRWAAAVVGSLLLLAGSAAFSRANAPGLPFPLFRDYLAGWMELEDRVGPRGARIAYAGTNIPYYLMGGSLQNDVRYVNVDAHRDWLMHDYHRAAPALGLPETWPNPFPGWDRARPDYDAWLANLRAAGTEILVVARVNPAEGAHNVADRDGFPVERGWAESHPEAFRPLYGVRPPDPRFRFYQVLPPKI